MTSVLINYINVYPVYPGTDGDYCHQQLCKIKWEYLSIAREQVNGTFREESRSLGYLGGQQVPGMFRGVGALLLDVSVTMQIIDFSSQESNRL